MVKKSERGFDRVCAGALGSDGSEYGSESLLLLFVNAEVGRDGCGEGGAIEDGGCTGEGY